MKAAVLYQNRDLRYDDWKTPEYGPEDVLIRVRAAGICGSDVPRVLHQGAHYYPIVLGHEFSGDVAAAGEKVKSVRVGDTVTAAPLLPCMQCADCQRGNFSLCRHYSFIGSRVQGAFADYVAVPERNVIRYDPSIPYTQAAMFEPSTVALHGLFQGDYRGGGTAAVVGCGTIGIFTAQWARIFGAKKLAVFDVDESRLALAKRLGADVTVNTRDTDWKEAAREITDGALFDHVFETAGNPQTGLICFEIAGNKSHVTFIGTPHSPITFTLAQWENMNRKEFYLTGSWMSYSAPFPGREWQLTAHFFAAGDLKFDPAFLFRTYPMAEAWDAFRLYDEPEKVHGKVMLVNET